jgi:hypothetical protein
MDVVRLNSVIVAPDIPASSNAFFISAFLADDNLFLNLIFTVGLPSETFLQFANLRNFL